MFEAPRCPDGSGVYLYVTAAVNKYIDHRDIWSDTIKPMRFCVKAVGFRLFRGFLLILRGIRGKHFCNADVKMQRKQ